MYAQMRHANRESFDKASNFVPDVPNRVDQTRERAASSTLFRDVEQPQELTYAEELYLGSRLGVAGELSTDYRHTVLMISLRVRSRRGKYT